MMDYIIISNSSIFAVDQKHIYFNIKSTGFPFLFMDILLDLHEINNCHSNKEITNQK